VEVQVLSRALYGTFGPKIILKGVLSIEFTTPF
jgi:hypothetical protein